MASAGTVTIDFAAETARFTAEVRKMRGELAEIRNASNRTAAALEGLGRGFRNIIGLIGVGTALRTIVKNTTESEQAITQLENALRNARVEVEANAKEMMSYASHLQRITTFGDEAIVGVQTLLLSFRGLSSGVIRRATADILDISARLGVDLNSAAKSVGKALEDPLKGLRALSAVGVTFTASQQQQIAAFVEAGEKAKAQAVILEEIESRFKGAAEAAGKTFSGALAGLKNDFGDLLEANGGLPQATEKLNELRGILQDPQTKIAADNLLSGLVSAATSLGSFLGRTIAGLKILITGEGGNPIVDLDMQIEKLQKQREELLRKLERPYGRVLEQYGSIDIIKQQIATLEQHIDSLLEKQRELLFPEVPIAAPSQAAPEFTTPEAEGPSDAELERMEELEKILADFNKRRVEQEIALRENLAEIQNDALSAELEREMYWVDRGLDAEREAARRRTEINMEAENTIAAMKAQTVALAIGLLQTLAVRSKAAAIALVAIEKGKAIAQAIQLGGVAVMQAAAAAPPPANAPLIAAARALTAAQVALIAGTGFAQVQQINDAGGAPLGTSINPIFTRDDGLGPDGAGATARSAVQITINGNLFSSQETADWLLQQIEEAVSDRDVVLIHGNSRNARDLRGD